MIIFKLVICVGMIETWCRGSVAVGLLAHDPSFTSYSHDCHHAAPASTYGCPSRVLTSTLFMRSRISGQVK